MGGLGLLGLGAVVSYILGGGAVTAYASEKVGSQSFENYSSTDSIIENGRTFAERYELDNVLNSDSTVPYISSSEFMRPDGGNDDRKKKKGKTIAASFLSGAAVGAMSSDDVQETVQAAINWALLIALGLGGLWVYKEILK